MKTLKKFLPYIAAITLFVAIAFGYFATELSEGKVLFQHDTQQGIAIGKEGADYLQRTGERTRWTNSLFGGMPTYQISPSYPSTALLYSLQSILTLGLPSPASLIFLMMLGFFILLKTLRQSTLISALGAIAWGLSSYFFIIIAAGHIWKFVALAFVPPMIAGVLLVFRKKYLGGGALFALATALEILTNHLQMTYYFLFVIGALGIAYSVDLLRRRQYAVWGKAIGTLILGGVLGVLVNASNLYHTYEYSKYTIRGASELTPANGAARPTSNGLDKDYITGWSYGVGESWTLLIPNTKGGATGSLSTDPSAMEKIRTEYRRDLGGMNHYWGDQPFTSGPVYVGAFILTLFVFGLFVVKGPIKWGLAGVTILTLMLSWGHNFMPLSDLFIDHFPMYNKFRAVSSILVVVEFTIPLLAILALTEILRKPQILREKTKATLTAVSSTAGIALLFALLPDLFFDFMSVQEKAAFLPQVQQAPQLQPLLDDLMDARRWIFVSDCWRSVAFIVAGCGLLFGFYRRWYKGSIAVGTLIALTLLDMGSVNKRYLNETNFVEKQVRENPFPETIADLNIRKDSSLSYRVFNLTTDPFNDSQTSYHHKSVGGYHAAKLSRYQDLIERQLSKQNHEVINMLNTKYLIINDSLRNPTTIPNPEACGNAWLVQEIVWANTADEEMNALNDFNPLHTAVVNRKFKEQLSADRFATDSTASVVLTQYEPNALRYESNTSQAGLVVFSEIYYPHGWVATIDGKEVPIVQADYVLRAIEVSAGKHTIEFTFRPRTIETTELIANSSQVVIVLLLLLAIGMQLRRKNLKA